VQVTSRASPRSSKPARHGAGGAFLFGAFTIADAMFAPVATRFRSYSVPLPPRSQAYVDALCSLAPMREWIAAGAAEPERIPEVEALVAPPSGGRGAQESHASCTPQASGSGQRRDFPRSCAPMRKLICSFAFALSFLLAGSASAQGVWNDGSASRITHHCVLGIDLVDTWEDLAWTWVGFYGLPQVGQVYYARITVGGLAAVEHGEFPVKLPRSTSFAISPANPCVLREDAASRRRTRSRTARVDEPFIGYPTRTFLPESGGSGFSTSLFPPMTQPYQPLPPARS
jgi:hypothetical protein